MVRLAVIDHLHAVLDRPEQCVGAHQRRCFFLINPARRRQRLQRIPRGRYAQRGVAPAMDQLVNLREKFDLANTATAAFQVKSRAERLPPRVMIADSARDAANFADRPKIERAPPHERFHRLEKARAERDIASRRAGADERCAFPRQGQGFIIRQRRIDRQGNRRHLGRRAQAQIHAQHVAITIARLQDFHHALADANGRFFRCFARAAREGYGVEQEDRVDVRRIVELAAALLAQRDCDKTLRGGIGGPFRDGGGNRGIERAIGEIGQGMRHCRQIVQSGQIANRNPKRQPPPLEPEASRHRHIRQIVRQRLKRRERPLFQHRSHLGLALQHDTQERRPSARTRHGIDDRRVENHVFPVSP
ncbi:hypothetical protein D9M73_124530 [compost metagenome]